MLRKANILATLALMTATLILVPRAGRAGNMDVEGQKTADVQLYVDSPDPQTSPTLGSVLFYGNDAADEKTLYLRMDTRITTLAAGAEESRMVLSALSSGQMVEVVTLDADGMAVKVGDLVVQGGILKICGSTGTAGYEFPASTAAKSAGQILKLNESGQLIWSADDDTVVPAIPSGDPTVTVDGEVQNGSATSWMRSDAAPALANPLHPSSGTQVIEGGLEASSVTIDLGVNARTGLRFRGGAAGTSEDHAVMIDAREWGEGKEQPNDWTLLLKPGVGITPDGRVYMGSAYFSNLLSGNLQVRNSGWDLTIVGGNPGNGAKKIAFKNMASGAPEIGYIDLEGGLHFTSATLGTTLLAAGGDFVGLTFDYAWSDDGADATSVTAGSDGEGIRITTGKGGDGFADDYNQLAAGAGGNLVIALGAGGDEPDGGYEVHSGSGGSFLVTAGSSGQKWDHAAGDGGKIVLHGGNSVAGEMSLGSGRGGNVEIVAGDSDTALYPGDGGDVVVAVGSGGSGTYGQPDGAHGLVKIQVTTSTTPTNTGDTLLDVAGFVKAQGVEIGESSGYILPTSGGTSGLFLQSTGPGTTLTWASAGGGETPTLDQVLTAGNTTDETPVFESGITVGSASSYSLPSTAGTSGLYLQSTGPSGTLTWAQPAAQMPDYLDIDQPDASDGVDATDVVNVVGGKGGESTETNPDAGDGAAIYIRSGDGGEGTYSAMAGSGGDMTIRLGDGGFGYGLTGDGGSFSLITGKANSGHADDSGKSGSIFMATPDGEDDDYGSGDSGSITLLTGGVQTYGEYGPSTPGNIRLIGGKGATGDWASDGDGGPGADILLAAGAGGDASGGDVGAHGVVKIQVTTSTTPTDTGDTLLDVAGYVKAEGVQVGGGSGYTLPSAAGTTGLFLKCNGAGNVLTWDTASGAPLSNIDIDQSDGAATETPTDVVNVVGGDGGDATSSTAAGSGSSIYISTGDGGVGFFDEYSWIVKDAGDGGNMVIDLGNGGNENGGQGAMHVGNGGSFTVNAGTGGQRYDNQDGNGGGITLRAGDSLGGQYADTCGDGGSVRIIAGDSDTALNPGNGGSVTIAAGVGPESYGGYGTDGHHGFVNIQVDGTSRTTVTDSLLIVYGGVEAVSYVDWTPGFPGTSEEALSQVLGMRTNGEGNIDHATLGAARYVKTRKVHRVFDAPGKGKAKTGEAGREAMASGLFPNQHVVNYKESAAKDGKRVVATAEVQSEGRDLGMTITMLVESVKALSGQLEAERAARRDLESRLETLAKRVEALEGRK